MKPVKYILLACAGLSALLVFLLPYVSADPVKFTLWELRKMGGSETIIHPFVILGSMVLPLVFGAAAATSHKLPRWQSIISVLCFALALLIALAVFSKFQLQFGQHSGIAAKLMLLTLAVGAGASLVGAIKPERA